MLSIFVSDLEDGAEWTLSKIADDVKLWGVPRDLIGLEKWADRNLMKLNTGSAKSCTWEGRSSGISMCWGTTSWKAALQKRTWESWWSWVNNVPLQKKRLMLTWAASGRVMPAGRGRWSFPCTHPWWGHTWNTVLDSSVQESQMYWWCSEQHGLVKGAPAHSRGVGTRWFWGSF